MFGLEFLLAGFLNFQAMPTSSVVTCQPKTPTRVNVRPSNSRIQYDFTRSKEELNNVDVDTVSPYGPQHKTEVSGLMSGSIQVKHEIKFLQERYERAEQGCVYIKSIDVSVNVEPTIFIAREHPKGSCMHTAVMAHEMLHVREDQLIVNKYSKIIGQGLKREVDKMKQFGPYSIYEIPVVQTNLQNTLNNLLMDYNEAMNKERRTRQQAIDSLEEYERIGARCK
ncbi:MAG: hypothetical protein AAF549_01810 [Pseudomonadota bacterium]